MNSSNSLRTIFIASTPENAKIASLGGADLIMVDLEKAGKQERQKTLSAHLSNTDWDEAAMIREAVPDQQVMIRLDPWHPDHSATQIDKAVGLGADRIMLPMIESLADVVAFSSALAGRARLTPLIETVNSLNIIDEIASLPNIDHVHIGLNDLHLQLKNCFLFEPLAKGLIDVASKKVRAAGPAFGVGGIGTLSDTPPISPELLLCEHARLGSTWVILSRQFRNAIDASGKPKTIFKEISALKTRYLTLRGRDSEAEQEDRRKFVGQVEAYVDQICAKAQV